MNSRFLKIFETGLLGFMGMTLIAQQQRKYHCAAPYFSFISHSELQQLRLRYPTLFILEKFQVEHIISVIRNKQTHLKDFRLYSDRLMRLLIEKAVSEHEKKITQQESTQGQQFEAVELAFEQNQFCVIVMVRSGNAFLSEALKVLPGAAVGYILVKKNDETNDPQVVYSKLPEDIAKRQIIIMDAMISSGGRLISAIKTLEHHGVAEENITTINIVSSEKGLSKVLHQYPKIKVITSAVDHALSTNHDLLFPGVGDFGDRYFGTVNE